jgi:hypothetical protein
LNAFIELLTTLLQTALQFSESNKDVQNDHSSCNVGTSIASLPSPKSRPHTAIDIQEQMEREWNSAARDLLGFACCCGLCVTTVVTVVVLKVTGIF